MVVTRPFDAIDKGALSYGEHSSATNHRYVSTAQTGVSTTKEAWEVRRLRRVKGQDISLRVVR